MLLLLPAGKAGKLLCTQQAQCMQLLLKGVRRGACPAAVLVRMRTALLRLLQQRMPGALGSLALQQGPMLVSTR